MKKIIYIIILFFTLPTMAQQTTLKGYLFDEKGNPLMYATAVLLHPEDSTLAYYGITNTQGVFEIKNINTGKYIFQASYIGYQSIYKSLDFPLSGNNLGVIAMKPSVQNLNEVQINAERIPILIKKDTVEYNAASYKTKPDAVVENLLKNLPGVEVDRAGNIKAQGEGVQKVLVDGKEFFGDDPKVATKNLPSDAIEKVQIFNKKSEETELTGIDDGSYQKTINLILKDGKKNAYFGDIMAGGANDERYQTGAKLYRFTRKSQFAALGMFNNINKFGFSFKDYLDFNGGLQSLMSGGGGGMQMTMGGNDNLPVDFGQPINGLITSGAGGVNYMYEAHEKNRFNISYLGNGANKKLIENTLTNNFSSLGSYKQNEDLEQTSTNRAHRLNFSWKNKIDSTQNLTVNGGASLTNGNTKGNLFSESFTNNNLINNLRSLTNDDANGITAKISASYLKKGKGSWKLFKLGANFSGSQSLSKTEWDNFSRYFGSNQSIAYQRFQKDETKLIDYSFATSVTRKIGRILYLDPSISVGFVNESLKRLHGFPPNETQLIDSLSPDFSKQYLWIRGGFSLKRNTSKSKLNFSAKVQNVNLSNSLKNENEVKYDNIYFIPSLSWDYDLSMGRHFTFNYYSAVNTPTVKQLLPVINTLNPLQLFIGNSNLKPEYSHNLQLGWMLFDQFSQTSIFANLNATYTKNKINWSQTIMPDLSQLVTLVNVSDDYKATANIDFSTPIRKLGLNFHAGVNESWNQGINFVNELQNTTTNFNHSLTISFDNRKKEKWDISIGGTANISDAKYSIQNSLNKTYLNLSGFSEISYTPNDNWFFSVIADVTRYDARSFDKAISIPLLRAEISRYFLKHKQGVITLEAVDLLDKNKGIERISDMNYLLEKQSNIIGRYFMLSFKYRLNKFENKSGIDIKVGKR